MHFVGKVLATREEVLQAEQVSNHGGYVITNETGTWGLDCFQTAARHQCFASMANSPYMCKDVSRNIHPSANVQKSCKRMGNGGTCVFGLIASQDIPAFTEILLNYVWTIIHFSISILLRCWINHTKESRSLIDLRNRKIYVLTCNCNI